MKLRPLVAASAKNNIRVDVLETTNELFIGLLGAVPTFKKKAKSAAPISIQIIPSAW